MAQGHAAGTCRGSNQLCLTPCGFVLMTPDLVLVLWAALTMYHKLGGLNNNLWFPALQLEVRDQE